MEDVLCTIESVMGAAEIDNDEAGSLSSFLKTDDDIWMDVEFYAALKQYLRTGQVPKAIPERRKSFIQKRAQQYRLENGEVMYGDKIVIVEAEERRRLLSNVHVNPKTFGHTGAEKMYEDLQKHFYWHCMHAEIVRYVQGCSKCASKLAMNNLTEVLEEAEDEEVLDEAVAAPDDDSASEPMELETQQPLNVLQMVASDGNSIVMPENGNILTLMTLPVVQQLQPVVQSVMQPVRSNVGVWDVLELKILKIFTEQPTLAMSLSDPVSRWMDMRPTRASTLLKDCVEFLLNHMSVLGFARFHVIGFSEKEQEKLLLMFSEKYMELTGNEWPNVPLKNTELCPWVQQMLNTFNLNRLQQETLLYRSKSNPELNGATPNSQILMHPKVFLASPTGSLNLGDFPNIGPDAETLLGKECLDEQTITAIQAHIAAKNEAPNKRGPYLKFSAGLKKAIAKHAKKNGSKATAELFSKLIGQPLTSATVWQVTHKHKKNENATGKSANEESEDSESSSPEEDSGMDVLVETPPQEDQSKKRPKQVFSPKLRAEIAKYAMEHGNRATVRHFKFTMDLNLSESTVRSMRDKHLNRKSRLEELQDQLQELGSRSRGRPIKLGQHEEAVAACVRQLAQRGEKVNPYLALTAAKTLLHQRQPGLLVEHGGTLSLTLGWAKSFIKRIGLKKSV